jgi:hypothetical protein
VQGSGSGWLPGFVCSRGSLQGPVHGRAGDGEQLGEVGVITVDVEAELAKLDTGGWRPLRPIAPDPGLFP